MLSRCTVTNQNGRRGFICHEAVRRAGLPPVELASGAGHVAMAIASLCEIGMLFVRCKGGISHNPAESIAVEDADVCLRVLLEFLRHFQRPPRSFS
jgi:allantoate deiminase